MKISIVTDEISADPETAMELAREWGIHAVELRGFGTDRVPDFTPFQKQRLRELLDAYEMELVAIYRACSNVCTGKSAPVFPCAPSTTRFTRPGRRSRQSAAAMWRSFCRDPSPTPRRWA